MNADPERSAPAHQRGEMTEIIDRVCASGGLHRLERGEERHRAVGQRRLDLFAWLSEEFSGYRPRGEDRLSDAAKVRPVLGEGVKVLLTLEDDALGLIFVEISLVLQRPGVLGSHDVHALRRETFELLKGVFVKLEPSDPLKLTHFSLPVWRLRPPRFRLAVGRRTSVAEGEVEVNHRDGTVTAGECLIQRQ